MDYQKIYDNLMKKRLENPPTGKFERHHIVPRSLGGSNNDDNIVKLTYREHFMAHLLLCKIYKPKGGEDYKKDAVCDQSDADWSRWVTGQKLENV